jgi:hypothetical protein
VRPRPVPSRHDATAQQFLVAAAELIDAFLQVGPIRPEQSARLRHIRFPSALDWLRLEDVIWLGGRTAGGRKEFFNRWTDREQFLSDALVYALLRDYEADDPRAHVERLPTIPGAAVPVSELVIGIADGLLAALVRHPRSYLVLHLGPLLPRHPRLWTALTPETCTVADVWGGMYARLVRELDLVMRPEWTMTRVSLVLQAMLDGFVLRYRLQPDDYPTSRWAGASVFADAVIAFLVGAVDWDLTGQPGRTALDRLVGPQQRHRGW